MISLVPYDTRAEIVNLRTRIILGNAAFVLDMYSVELLNNSCSQFCCLCKLLAMRH
jgi:hypothetical protein